MPEFKPHWFGEYELLRKLGVGGMAEVFLARNMGAQGFEKIVVVKRMLARLVKDPRFVAMFVSEAKLAVRLQHANIVQILSLEEYMSRPFIVMEYVHGRDLFNVLSSARKENADLPVDFGIQCVTEMLKGLGYAHSAHDTDGSPLNLIHRDVTPSNIFVSYDGEVKLGDFGVAHSAGTIKSGEVRGKFNYLAPEALTTTVDRRADIFSAGVVLWEILAQRRLFMGEEAAILRQILDRVPEPPSAHNPKVAPDLDRIVAKALSKNPEHRFQTAVDFEEALEDYLFARRLRWTRRRIADVMRARYPNDSKPLCLSGPAEDIVIDVDVAEFEQSESKQIVAAVDGLFEATPTLPPGSRVDSKVGWDESVAARVADSTDIDIKAIARQIEAEQLVVYRRGAAPQNVQLPDVVAQCVEHPDSLEALGVVDSWRLESKELARLLYWDSLTVISIPVKPAVSAGSFEQISLTRLIYDLTVKRMSGMVELESVEGDRRLLFLDNGYPLYICSDQSTDGAPAVILNNKMLDNSVLYRGMVQVIGDRMSLDRALVAVTGVEQEKKIRRIFSAIVRSRLYDTFGWHGGRFALYPGAKPPTRLSTDIPPLLGVLVRAVRRAFTLEQLQVAMAGRGQRAVVLASNREEHVKALRLTAEEKAVLGAIDGQRGITEILHATGAEAAAPLHTALALLYVLSETRLAEFF